MFLVNKGGDINFKNENGGSILHSAAMGGNVEIVKYLIEKIEDIDWKGSIPSLILGGGYWHDITPLGVACHYGHLEVVKMLIKAGADKNCKINGDWTPIEAAMRSNQAAVVKYMLEIGTKFNYKLNEIDHIYTNNEIKKILKDYLNRRTNYVLK
jgi:ankyrin repeat protein